jgi:hypothetical protein
MVIYFHYYTYDRGCVLVGFLRSTSSLHAFMEHKNTSFCVAAAVRYILVVKFPCINIVFDLFCVV